MHIRMNKPMRPKKLSIMPCLVYFVMSTNKIKREQKKKKQKLKTTWEERENTLEIVCMKVWLLEEEVPRLFSSVLKIKTTTGVMKPSPTAPIKPNAINIQSTPSACMHIDLMLPKLFILSLPLSFSPSLPIFLFCLERERDQNDTLTFGKRQPAVLYSSRDRGRP